MPVRKSSFKNDFSAIAIISIFFTWPILVVAFIQLVHHGIHWSYSFLAAEGLWGLLLGCFVFAMWCDMHDKDPDPF